MDPLLHYLDTVLRYQRPALPPDSATARAIDSGAPRTVILDWAKAEGQHALLKAVHDALRDYLAIPCPYEGTMLCGSSGCREWVTVRCPSSNRTCSAMPN